MFRVFPLVHCSLDFQYVVLFLLVSTQNIDSCRHKSDVSDYWRPANESVWMDEMEDLRKMIVKNANIPEKDLKVGIHHHHHHHK